MQSPNQNSAVVMRQARLSERFPRVARTVVVAVACCLGAASPASAQTSPSDRAPVRPAAEPPGALPFDLAFDTREFLWSSTLSISRDGRRLAYVVRRPPGNVNLSSRYQPNGTPSSVVGGKVYVTDRSAPGGRTTEVCPGGNCWAPTLSPNGEIVAFYSDKDGPPQLWAFDVSTGRTRKLSPIRIKAKLWTGDEAQWAPDSRTVYVPTAPDTGDAAWLPEPETKAATAKPDANQPAVTVLRGGSEEPKSTKPGESTPRQTFYYRENNAALTAIEVRTGTARPLVSATAEPRPSVLRLSASGRWVSYLSVFKDHGITNQESSVDLAIVPATGGAPKVVVADLPLLNDYHGRNYAWHPTDDALVYMKGGQLFLVTVGRTVRAARAGLGSR